MSEMIPQESDGQGTEQCFSLCEPWECKYRDGDRPSLSKGEGCSHGQKTRANGSGVIAISCIIKKQMNPPNVSD